MLESHIPFLCPQCQRALAAPANQAGQEIRCPHCSCVMRVPASAGAAGPYPPPPQPIAPPRKKRRKALIIVGSILVAAILFAMIGSLIDASRRASSYHPEWSPTVTREVPLTSPRHQPSIVGRWTLAHPAPGVSHTLVIDGNHTYESWGTGMYGKFSVSGSWQPATDTMLQFTPNTGTIWFPSIRVLSDSTMTLQDTTGSYTYNRE